MAEVPAEALGKQIGTVQQGMPGKTIEVGADDQLGSGHGVGLGGGRSGAEETSMPEAQGEIGGLGELKLVIGRRRAGCEQLPAGILERESRLSEDFLPAVIPGGLLLGFAGGGAQGLGDVGVAEEGLEIGGEKLSAGSEGKVACTRGQRAKDFQGLGGQRQAGFGNGLGGIAGQRGKFLRSALTQQELSFGLEKGIGGGFLEAGLQGGFCFGGVALGQEGAGESEAGEIFFGTTERGGGFNNLTPFGDGGSDPPVEPRRETAAFPVKSKLKAHHSKLKAARAQRSVPIP